MTTWYKVLVDGKSCHGGTLEWPLPKDGEPGDWVEVEGDLKMCERGIHLTSSPFSWYKRGCNIWETEYDGQHGEVNENKICVRRARLVRQMEFPKPWQRVETFMNTIPGIQWFKPDGEPDEAWSLHVAAGDAARAAAWDAARDAARAAARDAAWAAARDAARAAAWAAAWDAARAAAWAAARAAAWDAARDAAWAAAWAAARAAAWDAAWAAARAAARDAAWAAALMALIELCRDTDLDPKHIAHAEARWRVWQKGYGLRCDVNGKLFVYGIQPEVKK